MLERATRKKALELHPERWLAAKKLAAQDPVYFISQFCWTYDPRPDADPQHLPFILYPYQEDYIAELEAALRDKTDLLTEKSRDMGVTWVVLAWLLWHWLFDRSFTALIGSRKEDLVDDFTWDSHFGRIEYMLDRLPAWLLPEGFDPDTHRNHMKLINPESGATLRGESANQNFSRQARYSVIFLDEFAFWNYAGKVWTATADATKTRLVVSTPEGRGNRFAELRFSKSIRVVTLHWSLHPFKDDTWYQEEKARRTPKEVAQELDIDYEVSGGDFVFPTFRQDEQLRNKVIVQPFEVPATWKKWGGLDYGTRNYSVYTIYAVDYDGVEYAIWEWRRTMNQLHEAGWQGSMVQAIASAVLKAPYQCENIHADPSLWAKTQNVSGQLMSIEEMLRDLGVGNLLRGTQDDKAAYEATLSLWSNKQQPLFRIFDTCPGIISELEELRWEDHSEHLAQERNHKERIRDKNNHSWDTWKYHVLSRADGPHKEPEHEIMSYENRVKRWQRNRRKTLAKKTKGGGYDEHLGSDW